MELLLDWEWNDYEDFMEKYGPENNRDAFITMDMSLGRLEALGIYIKHGYINPEIVDDFISGYIVRIWIKFKPFVYGFRENQNRPAAFEHVEYLYEQIKPIYEEQHGRIEG